MNHIDKNTHFNTEGNQDIDHLLYILDVTSVLSDAYKDKIIKLCLWILTNHAGHVEEIKNAIAQLKEDMTYVELFSQKFIEIVSYDLSRGLINEISKTK
jgi:endonuclease III-like uncharacterized protein